MFKDRVYCENKNLFILGYIVALLEYVYLAYRLQSDVFLKDVSSFFSWQGLFAIFSLVGLFGFFYFARYLLKYEDNSWKDGTDKVEYRLKRKALLERFLTSQKIAQFSYFFALHLFLLLGLFISVKQIKTLIFTNLLLAFARIFLFILAYVMWRKIDRNLLTSIN